MPSIRTLIVGEAFSPAASGSAMVYAIPFELELELIVFPDRLVALADLYVLASPRHDESFSSGR